MCWNQHSASLQFGNVDNWQHNWIHLNTLHSIKLFHGLETKSNPILDDHCHHGLSEAQQCDISEKALNDLLKGQSIKL